MVKFVITAQHLYWWPVKVRMPNPDPRRAGEMQEFQFKAQFEAIGTEEASRLFTEVDSQPLEQRAASQHDLLLRVVKGWDEDIVDETGEPVPFDVTALRSLLDIGWFAGGMWRAWGDSQRGEAGRKGN